MDLHRFKNFLIGNSKNQIYYSILGGLTGGIYGGLIQYDTKIEKQASISICTITGIIFGMLPIVPVTSLGALSLIKINETVVNQIENFYDNKN